MLATVVADLCSGCWLMSIESMMPSNHLIVCLPLVLLPSIFPSIRVFSNESILCIKVLENQHSGAQQSPFVNEFAEPRRSTLIHDHNKDASGVGPLPPGLSALSTQGPGSQSSLLAKKLRLGRMLRAIPRQQIPVKITLSPKTRADPTQNF